MATFTNRATLSYNNVVTTSNTTTGEIIQSLTITKTAVVDSYSPDGKITYVISLTNLSAISYSDITLTDDLGGYTLNGDTLYPLSYIEGSVLYYNNGVVQTDPAVTAGPPLTVSGISVPAGGNTTVIYEAAVTEFAPLDLEGEITNTVSATSPQLSSAVSASQTVSADQGPSLTITKSLSPLTVTENTPITYTFTILNNGNSATEPEDQVVLSDLFDPILQNLSVTISSQPVTSPESYSYNTETGLFTTAPGAITVPAASFARDPQTGAVTVTPGVTTVTVTGTPS